MTHGGGMTKDESTVPHREDLSRSDGHAQQDRKLEVIVAYMGEKDFKSEFPGGETVKAVKLAAMKAFGLEASSHDKYVVVADDVVVDEKAHIRDLGDARLRLRLRLKDEPIKG